MTELTLAEYFSNQERMPDPVIIGLAGANTRVREADLFPQVPITWRSKVPDRLDISTARVFQTNELTCICI